MLCLLCSPQTTLSSHRKSKGEALYGPPPFQITRSRYSVCYFLGMGLTPGLAAGLAPGLAPGFPVVIRSLLLRQSSCCLSPTPWACPF